MMQNKLPIGILKVDYNIALMGEDIVDSPKRAVAAVASQMAGLRKECGFLLCLDITNRPICVGFLGTGDEATIDFSPKEIAQFALLTNAAGIILFHNHPSNGKKISSLRPSQADIKITKEIRDIVQLFGINLQDHIIVNYVWEQETCSPAFYSMRSKRAYKNLFESEYLQIAAYEPEEYVFSGRNILTETKEELHNENNTNSYETTCSDRDRLPVPSL